MRDEAPTDAGGRPPGPAVSPGTYALAVLTTVFTVGALVYGLVALRHLERVTTPRLEAATALRADGVDAHIASEELLEGDSGALPDAIWGFLGNAAGHADALLSGGSPDGRPVVPLTDPDLRATAQEARTLIATLQEVMGQRLLAGDTDAAAESRERIDVVAGQLVDRAQRLQAAEADRLRHDLGALRRAQGALVGGAVALAGLAWGLGFRLQRRRRAERRDLEREVAVRKAAEAESLLLATAVAQASEIIFLTDAQARIRYVNQSFSERLGWAPDDVVGQYAEMLRSPHHEGAFYDHLFEGLREGVGWRGALHLKRKAGNDLEVEQVITPIKDAAGRVTDYVVVARDVSREKTLQAQMEHVQRLESLGVLAGGIAHDFNNILTSILGNAALAREEAGPAPEAGEHLARIEMAAARASELCGQMLAYAGKGRTDLHPVSLTDLVREMPRLLAVSFARNVTLRFDLEPDLPPVEADATRIRQVLMNLVINAAEAVGSEPGEVVVRTGTTRAGRRELSRARIGVDLPAGSYVHLEVTDTGQGMDAATLTRIFEPFFTTKTTGRGLGMSAVLGIVRGHHGALFVESRRGRGSTFRLLLPPAGPAPLIAAAPETEGGWRTTGRVLVVDDEPAVRQVTCRMLEHLGLAPETAEDGEGALERFRADPEGYALVMLDLTMPGRDGEATFRALREIRADVPVMVFSGYGDADTLERLAASARTGFIAKPFNTDQLRHGLRTLLEAPEGAGGEAPAA